MGIQTGDDRVLGDGQLMLPLFQNKQSLLFADIRGQFDDGKNYEGNWGLGLRTIRDDGWIVGGYAFYDRRWTENSNQFNQLTIGLEALSVEWEARVNGYLPDTSTKQAGHTQVILGAPSRAEFNGSTIVVVTPANGLREFETAYYGFDWEVGKLLKSWKSHQFELRGFAGGFHFGARQSGLPSATGPRTRLEFRAYDLDWFGEGSRLTLDAEYQWDQIRDDQFFAMARLRIPLRRGPKLNRLQRRMLDRIVRDIDIVTPINPNPVVSSFDLVEPANFFENGQLVGPVSVVDSLTSNPAAVFTNAGTNSTVIIDGSMGTVNTSDAFVLQDGQIARGAGFTVQGVVTGRTAVFGTRPTINGTDPTTNVLIVTNNTTVRDIDVMGGFNGIASGVGDAGQDVTNVSIINNTVTGAADDGFDFRAFNGTFVNNTSSNNMYAGYDFDDTITGTFTNNVADTNMDNGFDLFDIDGTFSNNIARNNQMDGFDFLDINGAFTNNVAENNVRHGFDFVDNNGTSSNNRAENNVLNGFVFRDNNGMLSNNRAENNRVDGFFFRDNNGVATNNVADNNMIHGFDFRDNKGSFSSNRAENNGDDGYIFRFNNSVLTNNTAINNADNGFRFVDNFGNFSVNSATSNGFVNAAPQAGGDGFEFMANRPSAILNNNSATNNADFGFRFVSQAGTATGNTASGNLNNNSVPN